MSGRRTKGSGQQRRPLVAPRGSPSRPTVTGSQIVTKPLDQSAGGFAKLLEEAQREVLTVSLFSQTGLPEGTTTALIRFRGRRTNVVERPQPGDQFVRELKIGGLAPARGPISITTRISDVNPGEWLVSGEMILGAARPIAGPGRRGVADKTLRLDAAVWSWRRWTLSSAPDTPVKTGLAAFARRPGVIPGIWAALVALGVALALTIQLMLATRNDLAVGATLTVSVLAIVAGGIGAKAWFVFLKRREHLWNGWCIQGFVFVLIVIALLVVPLVGLPLGTYLDITAPALLLGMAVGRIGCFFAGCCGGRPTCARYGIWSSDRRIGVRRVPTQLFESALSLAVAGLAFVLVEYRRPAVGGMIFVAALATYTLCRQALLQFRAEVRTTSTGSRLVGAVAALALIAAGAALVVG